MELILTKKNWNELKTKLRLQYPELTEADFQYRDGNEESLLRMIEYKLRKTKREMRDIIKRL
ncbi:MAG TPA: general stress protein CsbD [Bacteroidales bacterium]|nr:MAG: hypothetical protein A2X11_13290 [Bacteroidetes bacterium GWE2_42_24]OFY26755.1 MAG: hypothetical protein A2X09_10140 [Bacteroidetes bacterium GWF2_43_11]HBZ68020.1 general stress protein CsbD [Bacteroidales bacterium]